MTTTIKMEKQKTLEWYKSRIGMITGSECGKLFVSGRGKEKVFGKTAESYLYKIAAERQLNPKIFTNEKLLETYVEQISISSRAIEWGNEMEEVARQQFMNKRLVSVEEVGSCVSDDISTFAASPDGIYYEDCKKMVLEIKCPSLSVFYEYKHSVKDWETLKAMNADYYWQVAAEIHCAGAEGASFVVFNPFMADPLHIVDLQKQDDIELALLERVSLAEQFILELNG